MLTRLPSLLVVFFAAFSIGAIAETSTHCAPDEDVLFNCLVKGSKKVASVCGKNYFEATEDRYIQYRFGRLGGPEFEYPASRMTSDMTDKFRADTQGAADHSFSDSFFDFNNGGFVYEIWYREERQDDGSIKRSAGIGAWKIGQRGMTGKAREFICKNTDGKEIQLQMKDIVGKFSSPGFRYWEQLQ